MGAGSRSRASSRAPARPSGREISRRISRRCHARPCPKSRERSDAPACGVSERSVCAMKIRQVRALEILDSRGNPTVQAQVLLADGTRATAQVPSGASTGRHEAVELRDGDRGRYVGKGVLQALRNVEAVLGPAVTGLDASDRRAVDARLIETDASEGKRRLG